MKGFGIGQRLVRQRPGEPVSFEVFKEGQMDLTELEVTMALQYVQTREGAERIYRAELLGRNRPGVITCALKRMHDFTNPIIPHGEP